MKMSSAQNPRKFSEKIALLQKKAQEDKRAFDEVVGQVRSITQVFTLKPVILLY